VIGGYYWDTFSFDDSIIKVKHPGLLVSELYLKDKNFKYKGYGQELYLKALEEFNILYSSFPISEDAFKCRKKLEEKNLIKIIPLFINDIFLLKMKKK